MNSGATDTLTITLSGTGGTLKDGADFTGLGGSGNSYTLSGTAGAITSELDELIFTPAAGQANTSSPTTFTLSDTSSAYAAPATDSTTTVTDIDPAVAPAIANLPSATETTTSEVAVKPFSTVTVLDTNNGGANSDTLTIAQNGMGTLSGSGLIPGAGSTYTLTGTAAQITSALQTLVFKPVDGIANTAVTTSFTLSDTDATAATVSGTSAAITVTDTDPAVAPTITGTAAGQTTGVQVTDKPFAGVTIGDTNSGTNRHHPHQHRR